MNNSYQEYNFHEKLSSTKNPRHIFEDYGSYGGVNVIGEPDDVTGAERIRTVSQKHDTGDSFSAVTPTLPLLKTSHRGSLPFYDRVTQPIKNAETNIRYARKKIREIRNSPNKIGMVRDFQHNLDSQERNEATVPTFMKPLLSTFCSTDDINYIPTYNSEYLGGSLRRSQWYQSRVLFHVSPRVKYKEKVNMLEVKPKANGMIGYNLLMSFGTGETTYGIDAINHNDTMWLAARLQSSVSIWSFNSCVRQLLRNKTVIATPARPTSVCFSPYIPGELVISDCQGNFTMVDASGRETMFASEVQPYFPCKESWRSCHYSAHPRVVVMSDQSVVRLCDVRGVGHGGSDLFSLPNKSLYKTERIVATTHHPTNQFCHFISTDHNLLLLDERFTNKPVLSWRHMLLHPPPYISVTPNLTPTTTPNDILHLASQEPYHITISLCTPIPHRQALSWRHMLLNPPPYISITANLTHTTTPNDILLLASQSPPETCCFQLSPSTPQSPWRSVGLPWKLSSISDFTKMPEMADVSRCRVVTDRFTTSIVGVAAASFDQRSFTTFQLDSFGDVFYQTYHPDSNPSTDADSIPHDKTLSVGPRLSPPPPLHPATTKHCHAWIASLKLHSRATKPRHHTKVRRDKQRPTFSLKDVLSTQTPHPACRLCHPTTAANMPLTDDVCGRCGQTFKSGDAILQHNEDTVPPSQPIDLDTFLPESNALLKLQDPSSAIVMSLWKGDTQLDMIIKKRDVVNKSKRRAFFGQKPPASQKTPETPHTSNTPPYNNHPDSLITTLTAQLASHGHDPSPDLISDPENITDDPEYHSSDDAVEISEHERVLEYSQNETDHIHQSQEECRPTNTRHDNSYDLFDDSFTLNDDDYLHESDADNPTIVDDIYSIISVDRRSTSNLSLHKRDIALNRESAEQTSTLHTSKDSVLNKDKESVIPLSSISDKIPSHLSNVSDHISSIPNQRLSNVPDHHLSNISDHHLSKMPNQRFSNVPDHHLSNISDHHLSNISDHLSKMPDHHFSNMPDHSDTSDVPYFERIENPSFSSTPKRQRAISMTSVTPKLSRLSCDTDHGVLNINETVNQDFAQSDDVLMGMGDNSTYEPDIYNVVNKSTADYPKGDNTPLPMDTYHNDFLVSPPRITLSSDKQHIPNIMTSAQKISISKTPGKHKLTRPKFGEFSTVLRSCLIGVEKTPHLRLASNTPPMVLPFECFDNQSISDQ